MRRPADQNLIAPISHTGPISQICGFQLSHKDCLSRRVLKNTARKLKECHRTDKLFLTTLNSAQSDCFLQNFSSLIFFQTHFFAKDYESSEARKNQYHIDYWDKLKKSYPWPKCRDFLIFELHRHLLKVCLFSIDTPCTLKFY